MKIIFTIAFLTFSILGTYAQDIIVKNDKTEIKAKIEEFTETTIKYKKFEMLDGPTYNINKGEVFMIIYKNGTKEYIETSSQPLSQINTSSIQNGTNNKSTESKNIEAGHPPFEVKGKKTYFEGNPIESNAEIIMAFEK